MTSRDSQLYDAIRIKYGNRGELSDQNYYYDTYLPALHLVENSAVDIADGIWLKDGFSEGWAPKEVTEAVKMGFKAGFLLAKMESVDV